MKSEQIANQTVELRSTLHFRSHSWLIGDAHFYTGMYKTVDNLDYDLSWSKDFAYSTQYETKVTEIKSTPWDVPFNLKVDRALFNDNFSDKSLASGLHRFMAHFIDCVEHIYLQIGILDFALDGRDILFKDPDLTGEWRPLNYEADTINYQEIFEEYSLMDDTGHFDCVCGEAANLNTLELPWRLIIDSVASFKSGHYKGCVIFATSAIEVEITPTVRTWIVSNTYTKSIEAADNALQEMSNPTKLDMFFKLKEDFLAVLPAKKRLALLRALKWLNATRNKVVHEGKDVSAEEASRAIRTSGIFLRILWVQNRVAFFKSQGIELNEWLSKIPEVNL